MRFGPYSAFGPYAGRSRSRIADLADGTHTIKFEELTQLSLVVRDQRRTERPAWLGPYSAFGPSPAPGMTHGCTDGTHTINLETSLSVSLVVRDQI